MATDIAKLMILVEAKGGKEAKKELDNVSQGADKVKKSTDGVTKSNADASMGFKGLKTSMTEIAATYYLIQQAVALVQQGMAKLEDAYTMELEAETKLQQVIRTTGYAVGVSADEVSRLADNWEYLSGIDADLVRSAGAVASTFTKLSTEVFPDTIEQALNMSTMFGGDLQQSMIQLGTALNDPIQGIGRLRRIGISFTQAQKDQIKTLMDANDILGAQTVILDELEREIGGVTEAMGKTAIGTINMYGLAWEQLYASMGEGLVNNKAKIVSGLTPIIRQLAEIKELQNDITEFRLFEGLTDEGQKAYALENLSINEIEALLTGVNELGDGINNITEKSVKLSAVLGGINPVLSALVAVPSLAIRAFAGTEKLSEEEIKRLEELLKLKKEEVEARKASAQAIKEEEEALARRKAEDDSLALYLKSLQDLKDFASFENAMFMGDDLFKSYWQERASIIKTFQDQYDKAIEGGVNSDVVDTTLIPLRTKILNLLADEYDLNVELRKVEAERALLEKARDIGGDRGLTALEKLTKEYREQLSLIASLRFENTNEDGTIKSKEIENELTQAQVFLTKELHAERNKLYMTSSDVYDLTEELFSLYQSTAVSMAVEGFSAIGRSLSTVNDEGESFSVTMARMVADMTSAMSQMFISAGLQIIIKGAGEPTSIALGLSLMAMGGVTGLYSGFIQGHVDDATTTPDSQSDAKPLPPNYNMAQNSRNMYTTPNITINNNTSEKATIERVPNARGGFDFIATIGDISKSISRNIKSETGIVSRGIPITSGH